MHQDHGHKYVMQYSTIARYSLILNKVAIDRTSPNGRVVGIDIIPAQPPKGVSTIQGNFLSPAVQEEVKNFLRDESNGRLKQQHFLTSEGENQAITEEELEDATNYFDSETRAEQAKDSAADLAENPTNRSRQKAQDAADGRTIDVVLSDMCEPWEQTTGFHKRSLSDPYYRMMNTSGMAFRDHAGSMVRFCVPVNGIFQR